MRVKAILKFLLALAAAVLLPLGYAVQKDHYSHATRTRWSWGGVPLQAWQVKEDALSRWVRDVLNLPPDYFDGVVGGPFWIAAHIGALPGKYAEVRLFRDLWENASAEEKPLVRADAVLCLLESDWQVRELMVKEAAQRWRK